MSRSRFTVLACSLAVSMNSLFLVWGDEKKPVVNEPSKKEIAKGDSKPKITVAKDVTFFTTPLDSEGYVDYAAAINAHLSKGVTPENNAAVILYKAFGPAPEGTHQPDEFFELLGMPKPPADGNYFKSMGDLHRRDVGPQLSGELWDQLIDEQGKSTQRPWKGGDLPLIAKWIKFNEEPMKHVVEAVKRTHHYSPLVPQKNEQGLSSGLIAVLLPAIQQSRDLARVLIARAMNHLGEGRVQQAWDDLIATRKLGRLIGQGSTVIEALVGIAIEAMANNAQLVLIQHSKPDAQQVAKYLAELDQIDKAYPLCNMGDKINITERAMFMDSSQMLARGTITLNELGGLAGDGGDGIAGFAQKYAAGLVEWDIVLRNGNKWYDRIAKIMKIEAFEERRTAVDKINEDIQQLAVDARNPANWLTFLDPQNGRKAASEYIGNVLVALLLPAVSQARSAEDRAIQKARHLRIALALSAYRVENGKYPTDLSAIKKYLASIPRDIFNDGELTYKLTDDGYLLYSVGPNGKDEGGQGYDDDPPADDLNVRMPIVVKD